MSNKTILVVAAHPDDEVIGVGGTIAAHASGGDSVFIAILADGATVQFPGQPDKVSLKREQARKVAGILGAKEVFFGMFPDQRLDTLPLLEINQFIEEIARRLQPEIVYTHHFADLNADHRIAYEAAAVVARPFSLPSLEQLLCYAVDTITHAGHGPANFNVYSDISATLDLKLEAMQVYETELRAYPHPRSLDALRYSARRDGAIVGLEAAEVFQPMLEVRRR
jgi:LmbE family N-acetylglucosaminyl deacetylase